MSLKSKIEAVIYASEEPVTLVQLVALLSEEVQYELDVLAARQETLPLAESSDVTDDEAAGAAASSSEITSEAEVAAPHSVETSTLPSAGERAESSPGDAQAVAASAEASTSQEFPTDTGDAPAPVSDSDKRQARERERAVREYLRDIVHELMRDYADADRGLEIREVAGGFRFGTKPEYHDAVRGFVKSLKPALKLSLQALETLAVVAYKQPVTAAEISEIRGVDSAGVLGGLLTRKLIQTAGRKQVIGRPMLYKTSKEFLVRFGLRDIQELPSMEEFERMAGELTEQEDLPMEDTNAIVEHANARGDAEHIREQTAAPADSSPAAEMGSATESSSMSDQPVAAADPALPTETEGRQGTEAESSVKAEAKPAGQEQA